MHYNWIFLGGPKEIEHFCSERVFLLSFYVVIMQMSFYLMCPSGMWLVLFRWCGCPSTSGPDQSSTWCPIRVVLFCHVCRKKKKKTKRKSKEKKIPPSLQLCTTVRESVFSVWIQAQLCTRRCLVAWLKKKKKNKTCCYFMHLLWFFFRRPCSVMKLKFELRGANVWASIHWFVFTQTFWSVYWSVSR